MLDLKDVWTRFQETGDPQVRERIIVDCMPLVKYVVGKIVATAPARCDREELIQCGIFGLIDAVEKYDPEKGVKFETYAILRIRGAVIDELRSRDWVPRSKRKLARKVESVTCELRARNGRVPTVEDLAEAMDISREEMEEILQETSIVSFVSLDEQRGSGQSESEGPGATIADLLADESRDEPSARIELQEKVRALSRAITELPEQERIIITLYYYEDMRLQDIAELYGVSESRISQVHGRALILLKLRMEQLLGE
ncbi:MAG: FliA/WhiG family RNA polymerase sigma factor [Planctomycetota bacterium]